MQRERIQLKCGVPRTKNHSNKLMLRCDTEVRPALDIQANRAATKYSRTDMVRRVIWSVVSVLFRWSPRPCFAWRRGVLRLMGAKVGCRVHFYPSTRIYFPWQLEIGDDSSIGEEAFLYNLGRITVGQRATISHRAHLCAGTHDYTDATLPLLTPPIIIGDAAWICTDAFVGPGVTVGAGAVVGARAAVFKDVAPWTVVGGNPAQLIKARIMNSGTSDVRSNRSR